MDLNPPSRSLTAFCLIGQAVRLMGGRFAVVVRLSAGGLAMVLGTGTLWLVDVEPLWPGVPLSAWYAGLVFLTVCTVVAGAATLIRLYRFAAGEQDDRLFLPREIFARRSWRFLWTHMRYVLRYVGVYLLLCLPVLLVVLVVNARYGILDDATLSRVVTTASREAIGLGANALLAVQFLLYGPAASLQDRVSFEALSRAGAPHKKAFVLTVLLLLGPAQALLLAQDLFGMTGAGPAWLASAWLSVIVGVLVLGATLVLIGACSLAYTALRADIERETTAVLARDEGLPPCASAHGPPAGGDDGDASPGKDQPPGALASPADPGRWCMLLRRSLRPQS